MRHDRAAQRVVLNESVRDQVRLRLPRTLAFYQRHVRPRVTGERRHLDLAAWTARGQEFVGEAGAVAIRFDRDGAFFEDPSGLLWCYQGALSGTGTWAEHGKEYELGETALMAELIPAGGTMIDIGANVGLHCIKIARRVEDVQIHAFEPVGATVQCLRRNIQKNAVEDRIDVHRVALTDHDGEIRMTARLQITNFMLPDDASASEGATETVPCRRLDDVLDGVVNRIDLIKCDVEGGELDVLRGASETLRRYAPPLFIEIIERYTRRFGHNAGAVFEFLAEHGYRYELVIDGERRPSRGALADDLAATPNFLFQASA